MRGGAIVSRFFLAARYLIIIPVIGLSIAAAAFFIVGGIRLMQLLTQGIGHFLGFIEVEVEGITIIQILDQVHQFLIGTVLYITSIGFYQLFIREIKFPGWLKVDSIEELETSLIGVVVVVLAVDFLGVVYIGKSADLLQHGASIALPIAALGVFMGLRAWADRQRSMTRGSKN
jgi:uncharacterized membrane protein YqhA